ncbi:MAG: hypothetical protein EA350_02770 [Gemmatimonadales bacterium]|nr:MAG: hypothetical protein EA350_02770 [Gemmatimonadales bacterium]
MLTVTPRALSFGEILDGGFALYRRNFAVFFGIAIIPRIPEILYWIGVSALVPAGTGEFAGFLLLPWSFFAFFLTLGALSLASAQAWEGQAPEIRSSLQAGLSRWLVVAAAGVLAWAAGFAGFIFLIIPGLFLLASFFLFGPVAIVEGGGPIRALGRSWELSRGGRLRILGVGFVAYLIILIPTVAFMALGGIVAFGTATLAGNDPLALEGAGMWFSGIVNILGSVVSALAWPLFVAVTVVLYMDRRARTDVSELEAAVGRLEPMG